MKSLPVCRAISHAVLGQDASSVPELVPGPETRAGSSRRGRGSFRRPDARFPVWAAAAQLSTCLRVSKSFWKPVLWAALCPAGERRLSRSQREAVVCAGRARGCCSRGRTGAGAAPRRSSSGRRRAARPEWLAGWRGPALASGFPGAGGRAHQEHPPQFPCLCCFRICRAGINRPSQRSVKTLATQQAGLAPDWLLAVRASRRPLFSGRDQKAPASPRCGLQSHGRWGERGRGPALPHRAGERVPTETASVGPRPSAIPAWFTLRESSAPGAVRREGAGPPRKPQARFQPKSAFTFDFGSRPMVLALAFMFSGSHLVWAPVRICVSRARLRHMSGEVGTQVFLQTGPRRGRSCCWDEPVLMQVPGRPAGVAWPPAPHPWRYRWPIVAAEETQDGTPGSAFGLLLGSPLPSRL